MPAPAVSPKVSSKAEKRQPNTRKDLKKRVKLQGKWGKSAINVAIYGKMDYNDKKSMNPIFKEAADGI